MPIEDRRKGVIEFSISDSQPEINDLIGNPPGWLLHSGITMIAIITTLFITGSQLFKYPDKLIGAGTMTSVNPPIEIISRTTGYIDEINFGEGDYVKKGEPIVFINNTTDDEEVKLLENWIEKYEEIEHPKDYLNLDFVDGLQLGSLQTQYANLQLKYNELVQTLKDGIIFQQINNLNREIEKMRKLKSSQLKEKEIFHEELVLSKKDYDRNIDLLQDGVVTELNVEQVKTGWLQKERQFEGMNNQVIQINIKMEQLQLEILKLKGSRAKVINDYLFSISEITTKIKTLIEDWNKIYCIRAPINGTITFNKDINLSQNLDQGEVMGYVLPEESSTRYVSAMYPTTNIGKVEKGQKVILKFDAYPYKEYGVVISQVGVISTLPLQNDEGVSKYEIKIPLPNPIITDYNKAIQYNPKMTLRAEIVTKDMTVFERIFDQFLSLTKQDQ